MFFLVHQVKVIEKLKWEIWLVAEIKFLFIFFTFYFELTFFFFISSNKNVFSMALFGFAYKNKPWCENDLYTILNKLCVSHNCHFHHDQYFWTIKVFFFFFQNLVLQGNAIMRCNYVKKTEKSSQILFLCVISSQAEILIYYANSVTTNCVYLEYTKC